MGKVHIFCTHTILVRHVQIQAQDDGGLAVYKHILFTDSLEVVSCRLLKIIRFLYKRKISHLLIIIKPVFSVVAGWGDGVFSKHEDLEETSSFEQLRIISGEK